MANYLKCQIKSENGKSDFQDIVTGDRVRLLPCQYYTLDYANARIQTSREDQPIHIELLKRDIGLEQRPSRGRGATDSNAKQWETCRAITVR